MNRLHDSLHKEDYKRKSQVRSGQILERRCMPSLKCNSWVLCTEVSRNELFTYKRFTGMHSDGIRLAFVKLHFFNGILSFQSGNKYL
jgi:hypothetical protein